MLDLTEFSKRKGTWVQIVGTPRYPHPRQDIPFFHADGVGVWYKKEVMFGHRHLGIPAMESLCGRSGVFKFRSEKDNLELELPLQRANALYALVYH